MNRDPLDEAGGLNLYVLVKNNSINIIDPFGIDGSYPDALTFGGSGTISLLIGLTGGWEIVVNSESGEVSFFANGGFEGGLTSFGVNAKGGAIWNLDKSIGYNGPFLSGNLAGGPLAQFGISDFATSDNILSPNIVPGSYGLAGTAGVSPIPVTVSLDSKVYHEIATIPLLNFILDPTGTILNLIDKDPLFIPALDNCN